MIREYLHLALRTLRANRLRSGLTLLAIAIAVSAIIVLVSLAQSGLATIVKGIEKVGGTRFIMVWEDSPKKAAQKLGNYTRGLRYADVLALKARIPDIARITAVTRDWDDDKVPIRTPGHKNHKTDLIGTDEHFLATFAIATAAGRSLNARDLETRAPVCVLGQDLAKKLYPTRTGVGKEIVVGDDRYLVVGQLAKARVGSMNFGWDWNDCAIVPLTGLRPDGRITLAALTSRHSGGNQAVLDRANAVLLARHNGVDDFQFLDFGTMLKNFYRVFVAMILIVGLIAGMSLIIGGIGIMNIMLVAVVERRREIGLRKAVGASKAAIMNQFLVESAVLSLVGALMGMVCGLGVAQLASTVGSTISPDWVGVVSFPAVFTALIAAVSTGLFFGWYPARQAARSDPIVCLKSE